MRKYFFITVLLCSTMIAWAQVQVRDEPRHHNVFENKCVRLLDVYLAPHDTTQYHVHSTPSVFLVLRNAVTGSQLLGQAPVQGQLLGRNAVVETSHPTYDSLVTSRTHRVWNDDNVWFHVMDIELTAGKPNSDPKQLKDRHLQLAFDKPLVNGYAVQLQSNNTLQLPPSTTGYLVISTGDAVIDYKTSNLIQQRIMKAGHYIWIEPGKASSITSGGNSEANLVLLQLK